MVLGDLQDRQTVTADGKRVERLIDGVILRPQPIHIDARGEVGEVYDPRWQVMPDPLVYVYYSMIRPGAVKGWVYHKQQTDRFYVMCGFLKVVLFDPRANSPTKDLVNEIFLTERNRNLVTIPPLVIHAVENIGTADCYHLNMPTAPYNHASPDKFRVPPENVPYRGFRQKFG
jgi:dTDP-4-dehydrorhamnose 3,5-epimerase